MNRIIRAIATLALAAVLLSAGVAYHLGSSHGYAKANAEWSAMVSNDSNSDPSLNHSVYWSLGYAHGLAFGGTDARIKMFNECGAEIIKITVAANDPKALGRALVDGFVDPSQVQKYGDSK